MRLITLPHLSVGVAQIRWMSKVSVRDDPTSRQLGRRDHLARGRHIDSVCVLVNGDIVVALRLRCHLA